MTRSRPLTSKGGLYKECGLGMLGFVSVNLAAGGVVLAMSLATRGGDRSLLGLLRDQYSPVASLILGLGGAAWTLYWTRRHGLRIPWMKSGGSRRAEWLLFGALVGSVLCALLGRVVREMSARDMPPTELSPILLLEWAWLLAGIVVVALGEEMFFRGYLQERVAAAAGTAVSIGLSTLLFSLMHGFHIFWELSLVSVACGILAVHGGVGPAVTCHVGWNVAVHWSAAVPFPQAGIGALWILAVATLLAFSARRTGGARDRDVGAPEPAAPVADTPRGESAR